MIYVFVYGGDSLESDISFLTYKKVTSSLKSSNNSFLGVFLDRDGTFYLNHNDKLIKGDFIKKEGLNYFKTKFKKYIFDYVFPLVHGRNVEDGSLGAYFDILKIPCIYSGIDNASILQNKKVFKELLNYYNIPNTKFVSLDYTTFMGLNFDLNEHIKSLKFPFIVKPVHLGSSIGVNKANNESELLKALDNAFMYEEEVLIEEVVSSLKEINIAMLGYKNEIECTKCEVVSKKDEVYSFFDKYCKERNEVHERSEIEEDLYNKIVELSIKTFKNFDCFGVIRIDYLYDESNKRIYLNEINTIPGSLALMYFENENKDADYVVTKCKDLYLKKKSQIRRLYKTYKEIDKSQLLEKD